MNLDQWDQPAELYDSHADILDGCETDLVDSNVVVPSAGEISELMERIAATASSPDEPAQGATGDRSESNVAVDPPADTEWERDHRESADVTIDSLDEELREAFLDDATHCVGAIEQALLRLEANPDDDNALGEICRQLHTLKGASASVGLALLADQLHRLEEALRDDQQAQRGPQIQSLLNSVDSIRAQIAGGGTPPAPTSESIPGETPAGAAETLPSLDDSCDEDETVRVKSSQLNRLMDMLAQLVMLRNRRDTELADLQRVYRELIGSAAKMRLLSNDSGFDCSERSSVQLSEVANDILEIAGQVRDCGQPIADGNAAVSQFIRDFRQELVELRRSPIAALFRRLQRVVRDAAEAEGKQVRLELIGQEAAIERSLQQRLYEPLLHIIRNSVCHGIESPEVRRRSGKEASGIISLRAESGPDLFVIEVSDDGGGLDYEAIRRRGMDSGLLESGGAANHQELAQLIFHPGFSTRATADQIAGRGVGMDVVAATLQRMQGWLEVESTPGRGTRIRLSFPLPSVIQHAMVFRAGGQLFALPMQSVQTTGQSDRRAATVNMTELVFGDSSHQGDRRQQIALAFHAPVPGNHSQDRLNPTGPVVLEVDEIIGPEELVIRGLPALLKNHPYCCGASLSGMGQTVLFLDARRLVQSYFRQTSDLCEIRSIERPSAGSLAVHGPAPRVLVVDDSISARKRVVRSLRRYSLQIDEACDGKQALAMLKGEQYAAVFSDMEMPHVSGLELLADINATGSADAPPVTIISSRSEAEFTDRAHELGAAAYLAKPLTDDALDQAIRQMPALCPLASTAPLEGAVLTFPTISFQLER